MIYYQGKADGAWEPRRQTEAARAALLAALRAEYGIRRLPEIAADALGKPFFPQRSDIFFNYSHCRAGVLVGVSRGRIGVDAETLRVFPEKLKLRVCHPAELAALDARPDKNTALTRLWVAKEAYVKYTGQGMRTDFRGLDLSALLLADAAEYAGAHICVWTAEGVFLCACAQEPECLSLVTLPASGSL